MKSYSIFIPTYNASNYLPGLLKKIDTLTDKICIVDSNSHDTTVDIARNQGVKNITIINTDDFDHGGTRALAKCTTTDSEIVVFLTQDATPVSSKDIERLLTAFEDSSVAAAYGRQLPYDDASLFGEHLRQFNYPNQGYVRSFKDKNSFGIKTTFISNSFAAYRRSAMDDIDWFKKGLILGEDTFAAAKLMLKGYKVAYVPEAKVYHSHNYTIIEEFKRYFDIGAFHTMEDWILEEFGNAEGEGMRFIKSEIKLILSRNKFNLIPEWFLRNLMKYSGYKLGRIYRLIPLPIIQKLSMHHRWWNNNA